MGTTPRGTTFDKDTLLEQIARVYDGRMDELDAELTRLVNDRLDERYALWRASAERRVADLHKRVREGQATDAELTSFRIGTAPKPDDHEYKIQALEREQANLAKVKERALAYARSLHAPNGTVTLLAPDLKRIGYSL